MGTALSEQRAARSFAGATIGRAVYVRADRAGIEYGHRSSRRTVGLVGTVGSRGHVRPRSVFAPTSGEMRYGTAPRQASAGVQVSRAHSPSHGRGRSRSGFSAVVATFVITAGIVAGLDAIANLRSAQTDSVPPSADTAQVHEGGAVGGMTDRGAPETPVAHTIDRIVELNALSSTDIRPGQK